MAKAVRIDSPTVDSSGNITIRYTIGVPGSLPASRSKTGFQFPNRAAAIAWLREFENELTPEQLVRLAALSWLRSDATLTNLATGDGKICTIDFTNAQPFRFT